MRSNKSMRGLRRRSVNARKMSCGKKLRKPRGYVLRMKRRSGSG
jgi:hypothetical protein